MAAATSRRIQASFMRRIVPASGRPSQARVEYGLPFAHDRGDDSMRPIAQLLTQYAAYHRDRRNIATHFAGIPLIVFAVVLALATVSFPVAGLAVTPAAVACVAAAAYYFRLDAAFGAAMAAVFFAMCAAASEATARLGDGGSIALAAALFV